MKSIAIFGATGLLGTPVTNEFISSGYDVRILTRNPEKATDLFGATVKILKGGLDDLGAIEKTISGVESVYINLSVDPESSPTDFQPEREGLMNIIAVSKQSGIKRIGFISSLVHNYQGMNGFNWWAFDIKKDAIAFIKRSGIPYTIFYPSTFMENFDKGNYIAGKKIQIAGKSHHKMYWIAGEDYARQVVRAFNSEVSANMEYPVQGPEAYTADEAADLIVNNFTRSEFKIVRAPIGMIKMLGLFSRKMNYVYHIVEALNNYPEKFESSITWDHLGKPEISFRDYIKRL